MPEKKDILTANQKALTINLDSSLYGTFAEIGAGQETARNFFHAGGAAGTIAKTISAYDMTFSDSIYGKCKRYVSKDRLRTMLDKEYALLIERLGDTVGEEKKFFAYANTVKAKSYRGPNDGNGWLGVRFQLDPGGKPNDILIHARMWDEENIEQQNALGILGTNLIYAAFFHSRDLDKLLQSLLDNLGSQRIEVDYIHLDGPDFEKVDNRIANLQLVRRGLTNAALFSPEGEVQLAAEVLYKKAVLVERGSFRPVTKVNIDMLKCSGTQFIQEPDIQGKNVIVLAEITMNNLLSTGELDYADFLHRIDTLGATGNYVLISNYFEFYRLTSYFRLYTKEMIGVAMGINNLLEIFNPKYYASLEGGILENFGRLFRNHVKLYIYPMKQKAYRHYLELMAAETKEKAQQNAITTMGGIADEMLITCENLRIDNELAHLYQHLLENGFMENIKSIDENITGIFSRDILNSIALGNSDWEAAVPRKAVQFIKDNKLFGYGSAAKLASK